MKAGHPFRVLVLCTGNSARSQIGEALFAVRGATRFARTVEAESAGSHPASRVNPYAVETLAHHDIRWDGRTPKSIAEVEGRPFDLVITVCGNAREACPYFPGATAQVHWGLPDPAGAATPDAAREAFARTYDALSERVDALLALPLEAMDAGQLSAAASRIHDTRPVPVF
ncbi:arsenate reductase ArsC [Gemmatimonas sp.]|jgi:arsenate reductase|uniref:arsenate reductase ArsC n=1 Tax=Gemmatimonas sp. TaxID=1962908 RepID=UPI0037BF2E56